MTPDPSTRLLPSFPSDTRSFSDLYPSRRGPFNHDYTFWQWFRGSAMEEHKLETCEKALIKCAESNSVVRTMLKALKSQGCPVKLDRHFSCDLCQLGADVASSWGGYDERANVAFVCANNVSGQDRTCSAAAHGLLSMFDRCAGGADPRNADHLACTEVRRANLFSCRGSVSDLAGGGGNGKHEECVKSLATERLVKAMFVEESAARQAVDRVFDKCYKDLEPLGRRVHNVRQGQLADGERTLAGYA